MMSFKLARRLDKTLSSSLIVKMGTYNTGDRTLRL